MRNSLELPLMAELTAKNPAAGDRGCDARDRIIPDRAHAVGELIATDIVWLLCDAASYATGAILDVAGGR